MRYWIRSGTRAFCKAGVAFATLTLSLGCATPPVPNPNSTFIPQNLSPGQALNLLRRANVLFQARIRTGTLQRADLDQLNQLYAQDIAQALDIRKMQLADAWTFGEVYRSARDWGQARIAFERAVQNNSHERWVVDRLRLAESLAWLGEQDSAIRWVESTFVARPEAKAPILPAVLYEIAPPLATNGPNSAVADLLLQAIDQHRQAVVNPTTPAGQDFLAARSHHIRRAEKFARAVRP